MMAPTFQEHHIIQQNPRYEVEVELIRSPDTATAPSARSALIRGIAIPNLLLELPMLNH